MEKLNFWKKKIYAIIMILITMVTIVLLEDPTVFAVVMIPLLFFTMLDDE